MDLKSMLNDSSSQRQPPRLHTPSTAYERAADQIQTPSYESQFERPSPSHQPPHPSAEYRASANGSYFAVQSPHQQNSATGSTPSVTGQPIFAQSPGPHGTLYTPRESIPPSHPYQSPFVPSPSPSGPQPPTPGSSHHYQTTPSSASTTYHHPSAYPTVNTQSPRDDPTALNGVNPHAAHLSPQAQFHPPPATPLGPPAAYPRPSPHPHRPLSQGQESFRRSSVGSVGSTQSREYNQAPHAAPTHSRSGSTQRTYSGDVRERERSIESVSPKTIPKQTPTRRMSVGRAHESPMDIHQMAQPTPSPIHNAQGQGTPDRAIEAQHTAETTPKSSLTPIEHKTTLAAQNSRPSPGAGLVNHHSITPQSTHSTLPAQPSPPVTTQPPLKRSASSISGGGPSPLPPRKRPRRDEIPIFAQSARSKPLKFIKGRPITPPPTRPDIHIKREPSMTHITNGQVQAPSSIAEEATQEEPRWESSITNEIPYEDITRRVCDWIFSVIGTAHPPVNGAMFEIEAKVGSIFDEQSSFRLSLPVETETIFNRDKYRGRTSFQSSMNMGQHKQVNTFLNGLVQETMRDPNRAEIYYLHPHEYDEFYELTEEGRQNLPQSITHWINPRHKPRVRRTIDETNGTVKAQIIKSRIADMEIYNPRCDFDYRISISIESPWEGEPHWLTEMTDGGRDRKKDRMSYRHLCYQIDLTQVSFPNRTEKEHELEVEISVFEIRKQLDLLQAGKPNRYEEIVRGFLDNVRILCRKGSPR